jgi:hypothetical protein
MLCCVVLRYAALQVSKRVVQLVKLGAGGINFDLEIPMQVSRSGLGCAHLWLQLMLGFYHMLHQHYTTMLLPNVRKGTVLTRHEQYICCFLCCTSCRVLPCCLSLASLLCQAGDKAAADYVALVNLTAQTLQEAVPGATVSVDVPWSPFDVDGRNYDWAGLAAAADTLFVMAYDTASQVSSTFSLIKTNGVGR